jgi:hypothetical protein
MSSTRIERLPRDRAIPPGDVETSNPPSLRPRRWVPPSRCDHQRVLSRRDRVEATDVPEFVREALDEIRATIERCHAEVQGPPFCIRHPSRQHGVDIEVGWPVKGASDADRISTCELPNSLARRGSEYGDAAS